jgi:hypothetical protein
VAENKLLIAQKLIKDTKKIEKFIQDDILNIALRRVAILRQGVLQCDGEIPTDLLHWIRNRIQNF